jgi:hypothetical protein
MTQRNKLIVGGVVVLVAYYLYDRNRKMKAVADLKAGAEAPLPEIQSPVLTGGIKPSKMELMADSQKELNFAGSNKRGISAQYFR